MSSPRRRMASSGLAFVMTAALALGFSRDAANTVHRDAGSIRGIVRVGGSVTYTGPARTAQPIDMGGDAYCTEANAGIRVMDEQVVLGTGSGIGNVVVYVKEGVPTGNLPVDEEPALLDQDRCLYAPRIVAMRTDQMLIIRNSDQTLHNVHVRAQNNRGFNIGQPLRGLEARRRFPNPEVGIDVQCDVHGWMQAYVAVFEHPFFVVTSGDGRFQLSDLPPGEYVLEAWHESLGVQTQSVTVSPGTDTQVSFVFGG